MWEWSNHCPATLNSSKTPKSTRHMSCACHNHFDEVCMSHRVPSPSLGRLSKWLAYFRSYSHWYRDSIVAELIPVRIKVRKSSFFSFLSHCFVVHTVFNLSTRKFSKQISYFDYVFYVQYIVHCIKKIRSFLILSVIDPLYSLSVLV